MRNMPRSVDEGAEQLGEAGENEMDTLDLFPDSDYKSRLACQIKADERLNGCAFQVKGSRSLVCEKREMKFGK
jgi:ferredoxin